MGRSRRWGGTAVTSEAPVVTSSLLTSSLAPAGASSGARGGPTASGSGGGKWGVRGRNGGGGEPKIYGVKPPKVGPQKGNPKIYGVTLKWNPKMGPQNLWGDP